jgi:pimeloyl-ACP methyl ester carboxylesterase
MRRASASNSDPATLHRPRLDGHPGSGRRLRAALAAAAGAAAVRAAELLDARRQIQWRSGDGDRHDGVLAARVLGAAGAPVVLLHGQAGSGRYWGAAWDQLATQHRVVVPDLLGFGASPRPDSSYDAEAHADAVLSCLDELGIGDPALLVAHSMGCVVALRLATRAPDRVAAVVAFGAPIYRDAESAWNRLGKQGSSPGCSRWTPPWPRPCTALSAVVHRGWPVRWRRCCGLTFRGRSRETGCATPGTPTRVLCGT